MKGKFVMKETSSDKSNIWSTMTYKDKNYQLFLEQVGRLEMFLERGAISHAQYDKSLHDLIEKTGYSLPED